MITPNSRIRLVKAPFEIDRINQLTFANVTAQTNYFLSLPYVEMDKATYQREDGRVRFNKEYDDIVGYNYCMYQNTSYSNKWFYAFIEKIEYANDGVSFVYLKTDAFQSWQFNIQYKNTFVEREHVNNDAIGNHTIPEGLEHGEYIINVCGELETDLDDCYTIIGVTWLPNDTPGATGSWGTLGGGYRGGVYSGLTYIAFNYGGNAAKFIRAYDEFSKADSIVEIFMCPKKLCLPITWSTVSTEKISDIEIGVIGGTLGAVILRDDITLSNVSNLNGYVPKNNKLFTYPYCVLSITNNSGTQANYNYEDFVNNTPVFSIAGVIAPGVSMKMFPNNYKKFTNTASIRAGYDFGIIGGKYPVGSWQSDPYTNWLTQQAVNHQMAGLNFGLSVLSSASKGDVLGGVQSTVSQIGGMMNEYYQHALQPPQSHGTNSGNVNYAMSQMGYTYYKMSIKYEYARCIDEFFSKFGYKVTRVKTPNVYGRANWNFVKTVDCNILGDIPQQDIQEIKSMFNSGVTFWHNPNTFLDYSQNNPIV